MLSLYQEEDLPSLLEDDLGIINLLFLGVSRVASLLLYIQIKANLKNEIAHFVVVGALQFVFLRDELMESYSLDNRY
jgi:hypothetical protein